MIRIKASSFGAKLKKMENKISIGTIFCHVSKINTMGQERLAVTEGNQKWQGGIPNFTSSPINKNHDKGVLVISS